MRDFVIKGGWNATIGIHEDGTKEVIAFGKAFSDDQDCKERICKDCGVSDVYYVHAEDMTDEEIRLVYAAHQETIEWLDQLISGV